MGYLVVFNVLLC